MIRINELRLPLDHPPEALPEAAARRLDLPGAALRRLSVAKRSHDARKKNALAFIYSVDVEVADEAQLLKKFADDTHIGNIAASRKKRCRDRPASARLTCVRLKPENARERSKP
ncbi:hypothetical protein FACS1894158_18360 [Betaproteobacteria bacterium]|nr:hypothetical protein FACS1894158_18360 [Betaproteobacteria bacterium]